MEGESSNPSYEAVLEREVIHESTDKEVLTET
jgi:hypothetical protein